MGKRDEIVIMGARQHNLQNINVRLPRNKLIVITGISGSGKSTLAFDTIFAEGQRRYVESLSAYARQFLGQMKKPDVDSIEGLSPAISIDQKTVSKNPRSTVGTVTEIYDHLRLLYARIGIPHCPNCNSLVQKQTIQQMVDQIIKGNKSKKVTILAPLVVDKKVWKPQEIENLNKRGIVRVRVDNTMHRTDEKIELDRFKMHTIEAVVDRLTLDGKNDTKQRLTDSVEQAMHLSGGTMKVLSEDDNETLFAEQFACTSCGISFDEMAPRNFSFNSPHGACPNCLGLGQLREVDLELMVKDQNLSLNQGALSGPIGSTSGLWFQFLQGVGQTYGFSMDTPWKELTDEHRNVILFGSDRNVRVKLVGPRMSHELDRPWEGFVHNLQRRYLETESSMMRREIERFMSLTPCPQCHGKRLKPESGAVTVGDKGIYDLTNMSVSDAVDFFSKLKLNKKDSTISKEVVKEILGRLEFLNNVGLNYLSLNRASGTLSGGEGQRIRLATQIGSRLVGVLYILDEPSIGLHQRDNMKLIETLKELRDLGNTLLVVEHDEETIMSADHILDLGPGAGIYGGNVISQGTPAKILKDKNSLTGRYISGKEMIPIPNERRPRTSRTLSITGASEHNLKELDVTIPLNVLTCVTGVSGSGKSTLVYDILYRALARHFHGSSGRVGAHIQIQGMEHLDKVIIINQSPIGRTPRSNPATYTGLLDPIRKLFAQVKESKVRGYSPGRFSFNVRGGRCEKCQGAGMVKIEMHFLPDIFIPCEQCKGQRYNRETLDITFKDKNIWNVLDMTVEEALEFFQNHNVIRRKLQTLFDVGLGYIHLGQPATTLSGGEAQRIKLATELSKKATGKTLYLLDEPTTGLHFADIQKLLDVLHRLTDSGNSVLIIEHNLDVIKTADYIIDLGPEGGDKGGYIVAQGTPEEIASTNTPTAVVLNKVLARSNTKKGNEPAQPLE